MKCLYFEEFGDPDVLKMGDWADPVAGNTEIIVDIRAASVNPADCKVRRGSSYGRGPVDLPYILGRDFSGVVRETGADVTDFKAGDPVFGVLAAGIEGTYAERVVIDQGLLAHKPEVWSYVEAAALALSGLTSLVSLEETAELRDGEKILIHGGAGGVGSFAVQLAKHIGAEVFVTASPHNHDYLTSLGAHHPIDYTSVDFTQSVSDCDVVFDTVGGEVHRRSYEVLKPGGRMVYIAPQPDNFEVPREDISVRRPKVDRDRIYLDRISELFAAGVIQLPQIKTMPLAEAEQAHLESEAGHIRGKIVLEIG